MCVFWIPFCIRVEKQRNRTSRYMRKCIIGIDSCNYGGKEVP